MLNSPKFLPAGDSNLKFSCIQFAVAVKLKMNLEGYLGFGVLLLVLLLSQSRKFGSFLLDELVTKETLKGHPDHLLTQHSQSRCPSLMTVLH